jgi:hypothetical protein
MLRTLLLTFAFFYSNNLTAASPADAPPITWETTAEGETAFVPMKSAPYPHPTRAEGHTYDTVTYPADPHYSDSTVGLFVPHDFRRKPKVNLLVYLHGWNNNVRNALTKQKIREQIVASGQNIILVFPQGPRDAPDSSCGKLEDPDGLKHLVEEALATLHQEGKIDEPQLGQLLLAGSSGAYRGIACSADHGGLDQQIAGIGLLDSSYGNLDMFVDWVKKNPEGKLFSIFTDHLSKENVYLFTHIQKIDPASKMLSDSDVTDEQLANARTLFLHTETLTHGQTVDWLERWLKTRGLE